MIKFRIKPKGKAVTMSEYLEQLGKTHMDPKVLKGSQVKSHIAFKK